MVEAKTYLPVAGKNPTSLKEVVLFYIIGATLIGYGILFWGLNDLLQDAFGLSEDLYIQIIVVFGTLVVGWMATNTNRARIECDVGWPHTFAPEDSKFKTQFDCVQRAHLNFVENWATILALHYGASMEAPAAAFALAILFLVGRIIFARGYYTGQPKKKDAGAIGYLGFFGLLGICWVSILRKFGAPF